MKNKQTKSVIASLFLAASMTLIGTATQGATMPVDAATQAGAVNTANIVKTVSGVSDTNFSVENDGNYAWSATEFSTVDTASVSTNDYLKSSFAISDEGVAAGEKVFEMSYSNYRNTSNGAVHDAKKWGLAFGLTETDTTITSLDKAVAFDFNTFSVFGQENGHVCAYNSNWRTVSVTGYAGGKLEASFVCPYAACSQTITVSVENVDFNGYFAFGTWGEVEVGKVFTLKDFSFNGNSEDGAKTVSGLKTDFNVVNSSVKDTYTWAANNFEATNTSSANANPILKSKFAISDEGVANGEKVFEMSYATKSSNTNKNTTNQWGMGFGLSEEDVTLDASKAIGFNTMNFYIYGTSQGSHLCNFHNQWRTMKLVGYAGGKLEVSWECSYCHEWQNFTVEGVDFNGYFAFGSWGTVESAKTYRMVDFVFTGSVGAYTLENGFEMDGASIRMSKENSGLRFTAQTLSSTLAELNELGTVEYGILYQDTTVLGENVLTLENYETLGAGMRVFASDVLKKTVGGMEYSTFNFAFYNIPEEAYTTERTVRFYAKVQVSESEHCVFYSDMISRSVAYVANCAYTDVKTAEEYAALSEEDKALYQYALEDGTYTRYSKTQREILLQYLGGNTNA